MGIALPLLRLDRFFGSCAGDGEGLGIAAGSDASVRRFEADLEAGVGGYAALPEAGDV